jgi:glycosyltransferase involved in cell wall biosynthesis
MPGKKSIMVFGTWIQKSWSKQLQVFCSYKAQQGYKVYFITDLHKVREESVIEGVHVLAWPAQRPDTFRSLVFLAALLWKVQPVMVIANFSSVPLVTVMAWLFRTPVRVAFFHTTFAIKVSESVLRKMIRRGVYRTCTHLVAVNKEIAKQAQRKFRIPENKMHVLLNSYPTAGGVVTMKKKRKIVTVAALEDWKGVDRVVEAFSQVQQQLPEYELIIIGGGSRQDDLKQLVAKSGISKRVYFRGEMKFTEVQSELSEAEIFVLLSREDGSPQVVLEAMANGCSVIATNIGGIPEMISHNINGVLVNSDIAIEQTVMELQRLSNDFDLRRRLSQEAQDVVKHKFSANSWAVKLDLITQSLK